jgi:drug/metabolite transporter (DMT)-like permease
MMFGAFSFATMGALSHLAGDYFSWQIVALARTSVAFIFSLIIALASGARLVLFKPAVLWMRSLVGSIGILTAFYALTHLPISTAITLSNTFPVWVTLLAWPLLGIRPTPSVWLALIVGIIGVIIIQQPHWAGGKAAVLAALGNALSTSISMIGLNRLRNVDSRAIVTHFSGVSTMVCLIYLPLTGASYEWGRLADRPLLLLLVGVGLAGTFGQLGMTRAFALGHPSKVAVVGLTQIVFAALFDLLLWKHRFDTLTMCGMVLIIAPTAWLLIHSPLRRASSIDSTA